MELRPPADVQEDHKVWEGFQYKFMLCADLYSYKPFFEKIVYKVCRDFLREGVTVVEFKHIFGTLFDDDRNPVSLQDEIQILVDTQKVI